MAYSGESGLAREIRQELADTILGVKDETRLVGILKEKLKQLHEKYYSNAPRNEKTEITILLAVWVSEKWKLYCAWGSRFYRVERYELLGMGRDTGNAIFDPLYDSKFSIQQTGTLAAYGLSIIKKYVQGCGGEISDHSI